MSDDTPHSTDPTLRRSIGKFEKPEFADVLGLSGAPVFNVSQRALCGMVMRGGMNENLCTIWYADMFDIGQLLAAVHEERSEHYYRKNITRIVKTAKGAGAS